MMGAVFSWAAHLLAHRPEPPRDSDYHPPPNSRRPGLVRTFKSNIVDPLANMISLSPLKCDADDGGKKSKPGGPKTESLKGRRSCRDGAGKRRHRPLSKDQVIEELRVIQIGYNSVESDYDCNKQREKPPKQTLLDRLYAQEDWQWRVEEQQSLLDKYRTTSCRSKTSTDPLIRRMMAKFSLPMRTWVGGTTPLLQHVSVNSCEQKPLLDYFHFSYAMIDVIQGAGPVLEGADGELLSLLEKLEALADRLYRLFFALYYRIFTLTRDALELCLYFLVNLGRSSEYPTGERYYCTTMPWTIWPALVVLWGVCWMFHGMPDHTSPRVEDMPFMSPLSGDIFWGFNGQEMGFFTPPSYDLGVMGDMTPPNSIPPRELSILSPGYLSDGYIQSAGPPADMVPGQYQHSAGSSPASYTNQPTFIVSPATPTEAQAPPAVNSSITTSRNSTRRNRTGKWRCTECNQDFGRSDVLRRHKIEQHTQGGEEFRCAHAMCKKSRVGNGFKRQEQLDRHRNTCKIGKRLQAQLPRTEASSPSTPSLIAEEGSSGSGQSERATSSDRESERTMDIENCGDNTMTKLRKWYQEKQERLEALRREKEAIDRQQEMLQSEIEKTIASCQSLKAVIDEHGF